MKQYHLVTSPLKLLKLGAINLLVLFTLPEIASLGFYFLKTEDFSKDGVD